MGWETDQPPVNYLRRRVVYYKKKRGKVRKLVHSENLKKEYGRNLPSIISAVVKGIEKRIREYERAIKKLTSKK